jgi:hypothetical protein
MEINKPKLISMKDKGKVKQGKRNKINGAKFESLVRKDLEKKGWIVSKWNNNVEFNADKTRKIFGKIEKELNELEDEGVISISGDFSSEQIKKNSGRLIPAKHKFNPYSKVMSLGTGFPDFIIYRGVLEKFSKYKSEISLIEIGRENLVNDIENEVKEIYEVIGCEVKSNGYLDKEERKKCKWLLNKKIFSRILIASKDGKRIKYNDFRE